MTSKATDELPLYSPVSPTSSDQLPCHVYNFKLVQSSPQDTCILRVFSHASRENVVPLFFDGSTVRGSVEVKLSEARSIKSVVLKIRGATKLSGYDSGPIEFEHIPRTDGTQDLFLELPTTLYPLPKMKSGKLAKGTHTWPFEIALPKQFRRHGIDFAIPPTFDYKGFPERIDYTFQVNIMRGMFSGDDVFVTPFRYLTRETAPSPSSLRQVAYREGTPLLGPEVDPTGWKEYTGTVKGTLFSQREVVVKYKLSIATPLVYPLGTPIPYLITLECSDKLALDMLAQPASIAITLQRRCILGPDATKDAQGHKIHNLMRSIAAEGKSWNVKTSADSETNKTLEGEIPIRKDLLPQFVFPSISVSYAVMLNFEGPGYVIDKVSKDGIHNIPIRITTDAAPGPKARSYAPVPGYDEQTKKEVANGPTVPQSQTLFPSTSLEVYNALS